MFDGEIGGRRQNVWMFELEGSATLQTYKKNGCMYRWVEKLKQPLYVP